MVSCVLGASQLILVIKNLPTKQETLVKSLSGEDKIPRRGGKATRSGILSENLIDRGATGHKESDT